MLSKIYPRHNLGCSDYHSEISNADISITPDNAYFVNFRFFRGATTKLMENFLEDNKQYIVFRFAILLGKHYVSLVAKHEPFQGTPSYAPSISTIKKVALDEPGIYKKSDGRLACTIIPALHPLIQSIFSALPNPICEGLFTIKEPTMIKAQRASDRYGFYKEWRGYDLVSEKNYGNCSMAFSIVGFIIG